MPQLLSTLESSWKSLPAVDEEASLLSDGLTFCVSVEERLSFLGWKSVITTVTLPTVTDIWVALLRSTFFNRGGLFAFFVELLLFFSFLILLFSFFGGGANCWEFCWATWVFNLGLGLREGQSSSGESVHSYNLALDGARWDFLFFDNSGILVIWRICGFSLFFIWGR